MAGQTFTHQEVVRFGHVDAAGIVFYPRYFEFLNNSVEAWFAQALGHPFARLHLDRRLGTPLVGVTADFRRASRLGEVLSLELAVAALGRCSFDLAVSLRAGGEDRIRFQARHVFVTLDPLRAVEIPAEIRAGMEGYLVRGR